MRCGVCATFNTREEKLLDGVGAVILRLICNTCGHVLESDLLELADDAASPPVPGRRRSSSDLVPRLEIEPKTRDGNRA